MTIRPSPYLMALAATVAVLLAGVGAAVSTPDRTAAGGHRHGAASPGDAMDPGTTAFVAYAAAGRRIAAHVASDPAYDPVPDRYSAFKAYAEAIGEGASVPDLATFRARASAPPPVVSR